MPGGFCGTTVLGKGAERLEIIMSRPANAVHPCIVAVHPFQRLMSLVHSRKWRVEDDLGILGKTGHQTFNIVVVVAGARLAPAQLLVLRIVFEPDAFSVQPGSLVYELVLHWVFTKEIDKQQLTLKE